MEKKILYVDSDQTSRKLLEKEFTDVDIKILAASTVEEAKELLEDENVRLVISESDMSDGKAEEIFRKAKEQGKDIARILFSEKDIETLKESESFKLSYTYVQKEGEESYKKLAEDMKNLLQSFDKIPYPKPEDEKERIEKFNEMGLKDLQGNKSLQRFSKITADYFNIESALIGIMGEDREYIISHDEELSGEMDREKTVSTFTLAKGRLMSVHNVPKDNRFRNIGELEEKRVKTYIGMPLLIDDIKIGTLSLISDKKYNKNLNEEEKEDFKLLSRLASMLIEEESERGS